MAFLQRRAEELTDPGSSAAPDWLGPRHLVRPAACSEGRTAPPGGRSWQVLLALTIVLAAWVAFLPKTSAGWLTAAGGVATIAAIASGVARDWERWGWPMVQRHPLTLIGLPLAFVVVGELLHAKGAPFPSRADAVSMVAYPLVLVGLLRLTRARTSERPLDTLLVVAIVPVCLVTFGWLPLTAALGRWVPVTHGDGWLPAAFLTVDALAVALTARLALLFRGKPIGYWLLLGAFAAILGAHTARAAAVLTQIEPAPVGSQSLLVLGFGLLGAAALHPSLRLGSTFRARPRPLGRPHLLLLGAAVVLGPVVVTLRYADEGRWVYLAVGAPAVVSLLVVAHLWRIVLERGRLEHLSLHDPLTGLPNRVSFRERLELAIARAEPGDPFAVGLLDLDRFKKINDSLGHAAGDELLRQVAARLQVAARRGDVIGRLGGDEFAFLLPRVDEDEAYDVSSRLRATFAEHFHVSGRDVFVSPSIGVAVFPGHGGDPEGLLRHADIAMYQAKSGGRDRVQVYDHGLGARARQDLALESGMHGALGREEFVLHYQPQLRLDTGELVGVEALVRWDHPELGLIPPAAFIHFAEESGLIAPLGQWVLLEACRQSAAWLAEGVRVPVAVNLSARQFQLQNLASLVASALEQTGLPCELLELELTESLSLDEQDTVLSTLAEVRALGVRCSIDDFGTGYSGLGYLSRYPIDALKLDRSFVASIVDGDAPIVRAIIAMAHSLNLRVVAEGVETEDQAAFLREQKCDILQGFLASEPVLPHEIIGGTVGWAAQAARSWSPAASVRRVGGSPTPSTSVSWDQQLLGERLSGLQPRAAEPYAQAPVVVLEETEAAARGHVQRTLVLSGAAGMLTLPVFLGLGAANALPPNLQYVMTASLDRISATTPHAPLRPLARRTDRGAPPPTASQPGARKGAVDQDTGLQPVAPQPSASSAGGAPGQGGRPTAGPGTRPSPADPPKGGAKGGKPASTGAQAGKGKPATAPKTPAVKRPVTPHTVPTPPTSRR